MSRELICAWLKIPADPWPPDHYALLGLEPGEQDTSRIERNVHQCHECLLRYQLTHPEAVTEAMNRLAQAFDCLSNPTTKRAYDAVLLPDRVPATPEPAAPTPVTEAAAPTVAPPPAQVAEAPASAGGDPLAWLFGPWNKGTVDGGAAPTPISTPTPPMEPMPGPESPVVAPVAISPARVAEAPTLAEQEPEDPVVGAAAHSSPARRGLGTKWALYYRISRTRQLLRAWIMVGKYFGEASFVLTSKADAIEMVRQLTAIRQLLQNFPPLLGQAGQPGYSVVALARQQMIVQTFLALLPSQREVLSRDWQKGLELLAAHRRFLREELSVLRRKGRLGRAARAVKALLADHPGLVLLLGALVAANLAHAPLLAYWPLQVGTLGLALAAGLMMRGRAVRRSWLERTRRGPERPRAEARPQRQAR